MGDQIREQINVALKDAVKSQDKVRMSTLRLINAAIKDRDIAGRTNGHAEGVGNAEVLEILAKMVKQRRESASTYEEASRLELAQRELAEIEIISDFLPRQLDSEQMETACKTVVEELDATGLKDMGRTMGALKERFSGQMDFGKASGVVKKLLG